jgi:hypothetical protein
LKTILPWAGVVLAVAAVLFALVAGWRHRRWRRREASLRALLEGADRLEADIKQCRERLDLAHRTVAVSPGVPAAGSADARSAVDHALRDLLSHRLWIRDHAGDASQAQLDEAVGALDRARAQIDQQLGELGEAQRELDQAVRDHAQSHPQ